MHAQSTTHTLARVRRVLLLTTDLLIGGLPTVVRELAVRLADASDVEIEVACLAGWGPVADQLAAAGIRVTALGAKSPRDLKAIRSLIRLIGTGRFDTVFSFLIHANVAAAIASAACPGVRYLQSIHTTQPNPRWHWWAQGFAQLAAERIVVPSQSVADALRERSHIALEKLLVIPNAIDVEHFPIASIAPGAPPYAIGFLGRLDPIKRVPDLLETVRLLDGMVRLEIFGEGEDRPRIERTIDRLGLRNSVTLHGAIARPQLALSQLQLIALPSEAEGLPMVLLEAMASGVPVVATDVPGIRDVVRNGRNGLLVVPGSPAALAGAIRRILEDPWLKKSLIDAARQDVVQRFGWPAVIRRYVELLELN